MNNDRPPTVGINQKDVWVSRKPPKLIKYPFVSVCCVTFNRRPFIPYLIKCFMNQTYPKEQMELIIVDDGTDPIGDLIPSNQSISFPNPNSFNIRYIGPNEIFKGTNETSINKKLTLGAKRNLSHSFVNKKTEVIVYMDDDDYYPPERVAHAVHTLRENPKAWCAASSEMHTYFKHCNMIYKTGPYPPYNRRWKNSSHGTAATFAFHKELLKYTKYNEEEALAEERKFLKDYTVPLVQLDSMKTILVFSHSQNSFDKKVLLDQQIMQDAEREQMGLPPGHSFIVPSTYKVNDFILDDEVREFYMKGVDVLLEQYTDGGIENKPDVELQLKSINSKHDKRKSEMKEKNMEIIKQQTEFNTAVQEIMFKLNPPPKMQIQTPTPIRPEMILKQSASVTGNLPVVNTVNLPVASLPVASLPVVNTVNLQKENKDKIVYLKEKIIKIGLKPIEMECEMMNNILFDENYIRILEKQIKDYIQSKMIKK